MIFLSDVFIYTCVVRLLPTLTLPAAEAYTEGKEPRFILCVLVITTNYSNDEGPEGLGEGHKASAIIINSLQGGDTPLYRVQLSLSTVRF